MLKFLKTLFGGSSVDLSEVWNKGAIVLDVRSENEFASGHASGAVNIPLDSIDKKAKEIKAWDKPVIACCASGRRSGIATQRLSSMGVEVYNGGSWMSVDNMIKNQ